MKKFYTILLIFASLLLGSTSVWAAWTGSGNGTQVNGTWYALYNTNKYDVGAYSNSSGVILNLSAPGNGLSIDIWKTSAATQTTYIYGYTSPDGAGTRSTIASYEPKNLGTSPATKNLSLGTDIHSIKVQASGTLNKHFQNVKVPMAQYMEASSKSIAFGEKNVSDPASSESFTIAHCNIPAMTYVINNNEGDANAISAVSVEISDNSRAGYYSTATITVKYNPTSAGTLKANLVISAGAFGSKTIALSGSAVQIENPEYSCTIADTYKVDDQIDLNTLWTSTSTATKTYEVVSFTPSGSVNDGATTPAISGTTLTMGQAGTLVIKLSQAANANYYAGEATKTITIVKYANPIVVRFDDEVLTNNTANMPYGAGKHVTLTATNPANTLVINQTAGADLATYYADQQAVYTSFKNGDATWTITQAETYKYEAGDANFAVHVAPAEAGEDFTLITSEETLNTIEEGTSHAIECNAKTISFEAKKTASTGVNNFHAQYSTDNGKNWSDYATPNLTTSYTTYGPYTIPANTTHVRFCTTIGATFDKKIRNVRVDYNHEFRTSIEADVLNMPDCRLGKPVQTTFNVIWSRPATSHNIHLESSNPHFTLSQSLIENVGCNNGTTNITITYSPAEEGEEDATITIYDESQVITLPVHGKTVTFFTPEVDWKLPAVSKLNQTYSGLDNIVTSSNALSPIVITSSDESIARYDEATHTITTLGKEGFVTFHVSQVANGDFYAIKLDFSMFVTDRENTMCVLYEDGSKHSLSNVANVGVGEFEFSVDAPVSMISADIWKTNSVTTGSIVVKWYDAEGTKLGEKKVGVEKLSTSPKNFVMPLPRETRRFKFEVEGTLNKYVQNIKVYRANYLEHNATLVDGALQFGSDDYDAEPTVRELDIFYSGAGDLKIESSNNALFTTTPVNRTIDCADALGQQHITVAYQHNVVSNDHSAELRIQLGAMSITIPMHGSTNRPEGAIFTGYVDDDWEKAENWLGGVIPADGAPVVVQGDLVINNGETRTVDQLTIESTGSVLVVDNGTLIVNGTKESESGQYGVLRVNQDGNVQLNSTLKVSNFYLSAALNSIAGRSESGQVSNIEQLQFINGNCYFDLQFDPSGACSEGWYMFTVPFAVDAANGISRFEGDVLTPVALGRNFVLREYSESNRANGKTDWVNFTGTLQPGRLYAIAVDDVYPIYRFTKQTGAVLTNNASQALTCTAGSADPSERGWCGIGNATFQHATLSAAGISKAQIYNHQTDAYQLVTLSDNAFVVGSACFVQTPANGSAVYTHNPAPAILRAPALNDNQEEEVIIRFGAAEGNCTDLLYISATDEAKSHYAIGRDLKKMGVSAAVPQIWSNAFGKQLCDVEQTYRGNQAEFSLSLFAPVAGEYILTQQHLGDDMSLYLLQDGMPVWDLAMDDYTLDLTKGTDSSYSLMLIRRSPEVTTGIGETTETTATKVFIDGQVFVLTNGQTYDLTGRRIR